jgi:hypothetical protein
MKWLGYIWNGFLWGIGFVLWLVALHYIQDWWTAGHPWFNSWFALGVFTGASAVIALGTYLAEREKREKNKTALAAKVDAALKRLK